MKKGMSPKVLSVLVGAAGLLVLLAGFFFLVRPQSAKVGKLDDQLAQTQTKIVTARALATQKPEERIQVADVFKVVEAMPDDADMTGIMLQLQRTADEAGVKFESITPQPLDTALGYGVEKIDLSFEGNYYSLTDFLFRLRRLVTVHGGTLDATGRLFSVSRLDFAAGAEGFPQITAAATVNAYVYSPAAALPAGIPTLTSPTSTDTTPSTSSNAVASGMTP